MAKMYGIQERGLRDLVSVGAVSELIITGIPGGVALEAIAGQERKVLHSARGGVRRFKTLEAAAKLAKDVGVAKVTFDLTTWDPKQIAA